MTGAPVRCSATVETEYGVLTCPERAVMELPSRVLGSSAVKRFPLCREHELWMADGVQQRKREERRG